MSDLNLQYKMNDLSSQVRSSASNNSPRMWSSVGSSSADSLWSRISAGDDQSRDNEDKNLNKSIFKSYLDSLRTRSDEQAQKILKSLENSPADTVSKLFGSLQTRSSENVGKLFEGLKLDSADEMKSLLEQLRTKETDKVDKVDETDKADSAAKADKNEETLLEKYLRKTSEKLSAENNALNEDSGAVQDAVQRVQDAFDPEKNVGKIEDDKAYNAAKDFVKSYNSFADAIKGSKNGAVSGKAAFIDDMMGAYSRRLERVGIEQDENGRLSVDREKLESSSAADREKVFGKKSSVADFIDGQAKQLQAYAQTDLYQRSEAYTDGGSIVQISNITGSYFSMLG